MTSIPVTMTETIVPDPSCSGAWFQAIVRGEACAVTIEVSRGGGVRPAATPRMASRWRSRAGSSISRSHIFFPSASRAAIPVTSSHCRLKRRISPARLTCRTSAPEMSSMRFEKSRSFRSSRRTRTLSVPSRRTIIPRGPRRFGTNVSFRFSRGAQVRRISPGKVEPSIRRRETSHSLRGSPVPVPRNSSRRPATASGSARIDTGSASNSNPGDAYPSISEAAGLARTTFPSRTRMTPSRWFRSSSS